jgi:RNA-directed DNA polymerase
MGFWDKLVKALLGNGEKKEEQAPAAPAAPAQARAPQPQAQPQPLAQTTPARPASISARASQVPVQAPPAPKVENPYEANEILGLSKEEMRKRALKINPMRTAWIGRVDTIPPQSDERTALIDRGLILRGYLKPEQIAKIHEVGDEWLKFSEASRLADQVAQKQTKQILEELEQQKAEKKAEKKRLSEQKKKERAEGIAHRKATDIIYLGRGVSSELQDRRAHIEALTAKGLPVLASPSDVAKALGLTVPRLRWLAFHNEAAERTHYACFKVPKRSGGERLIAAPMPELRKAQRWIHLNILSRVPVEPPAHGFLPGRSTVTNAVPHLKKDVVVNVDLADFFPSIGFRRVRGVFKKLGYSPAAATVLALLSTEAPRAEVVHDGTKFSVALGERALPQGAPTSPMLSNLVARKLDRRLSGMAKKLGWTYTRYADDLTFSAPEGHRPEIGRLLAKVRHIVEDEGFSINLKKGRVQRKSRRQTVTGVVVNEKPGLARHEVRRLRAILHQAKKTGLEAQNRDHHPSFASHLRGKIAYLQMIDDKKARALMAQLDALT